MSILNVIMSNAAVRKNGVAPTHKDFHWRKLKLGFGNVKYFLHSVALKRKSKMENARNA